MTIAQLEMIQKVKQAAIGDEAISAVLMYGSFIKNEGDKYSDIEFYLFCRRPVDHEKWAAGISPLRMFFKNEFGTEVAIFENLIRGEFHFMAVAEIGVIKTWEGLTSFEHADQMPLVDKDGLLSGALKNIDKNRPTHNDAESKKWLAESLLNNLLMVKNTLERGELAHAHQAFQYIQKYLAGLLRLADQADKHWENPTKKLEAEISPAGFAAYAACCPALNRDSLNAALAHAFSLAGKLFAALEIEPKHIRLLNDIEKFRP